MDISRAKDILAYWFPKNGSADFEFGNGCYFIATNLLHLKNVHF